VSKRRDKGIALVTTLLILLLMSTMIVGLSWLVMGDQKLGGNSSDRQRAFYGAESGLEALTSGL
jgi:Tfp pilus assembly protein PilX